MIVTEAFGGRPGPRQRLRTRLGTLEARAGERLGRRYPQRGVLGRRDQRRSLRLRHQLRRRNDLELRDRRRRKPAIARCGRGVDPTRGKTFATRRSPETEPISTRSTPTRRSCSAGPSTPTVPSLRSGLLKVSPRTSPGSLQAEQTLRSGDETRTAVPRPVQHARALDGRAGRSARRPTACSSQRDAAKGRCRPRSARRTFHGAAPMTR